MTLVASKTKNFVLVTYHEMAELGHLYQWRKRWSRDLLAVEMEIMEIKDLGCVTEIRDLMMLTTRDGWKEAT